MRLSVAAFHPNYHQSETEATNDAPRDMNLDIKLIACRSTNTHQKEQGSKKHLDKCTCATWVYCQTGY